MDKDKLIQYCIDEMTNKSLNSAFKRYGIEGTEEKIKQLYKCKLLNFMLKAYYKRIGKEK